MKFFTMTMLSLMVSLSAMATAAKVKIISDENATIKACPGDLPGCANQIVVKGQKYIIAFDEVKDKSKVLSKTTEAIISSAKGGMSESFKVKGYEAYEKGHFPNPMAKFLVFKITDIKTK